MDYQQDWAFVFLSYLAGTLGIVGEHVNAFRRHEWTLSPCAQLNEDLAPMSVPTQNLCAKQS